MNDALSTAEIKHRSLTGAKWLILMNGLGMPAAFLIALLLGRVGPAALGVYALAQILIGVITTFMVYGGTPVLSVFMPKLPDAQDRGRFLFSYLMVLLGMMAVILSLFWLFPRAFEFLLQREFDIRNYGWFVLLAIVIVAAETLANTASGLMLIKVAAIARQMMRLVLLPLVAALFFFKREILIDHGMPCILGGFLTGYLLAAIICALSIARDPRVKMRPGWLLPRGFWAFSLSTMAVAVFTFLYGNIDRIAVLSIQDVKGLGMYQAVLSVNMLLERIPALFQPSIIPTFSNLLAANHQSAFKRAFSLLCRWAVIPITLASLIVMGFSREILGLFGHQYAEYSDLLTLFGFVAIIRSLNLPVLTIVVCMERNIFRFCQSFLMILSQAILTLVLMSRFGIMAIAGAKMFSVSVAAIVSLLYVFNRLRLETKLPRAYKAAVIAGAVMLLLRLVAVPPGWSSSAILTVVCLSVFLFAARLRWTEILSLFFAVAAQSTAFSTALKESEEWKNGHDS